MEVERKITTIYDHLNTKVDKVQETSGQYERIFYHITRGYKDLWIEDGELRDIVRCIK